MVLYRRNRVPGGAYFFTVTLLNRRASTLVDHIDALRGAVRQALREAPFRIDAWVVLPDHLHTLWTLPAGDDDYSGRWRFIKARFTHQLVKSGLPLHRNPRGEYALWQPRFWEHTLRDQDDFSRHVDYVHYNLVKHGLVSHVGDWPYSTFHRYVREGLYPLDWGSTTTESPGDYGE